MATFKIENIHCGSCEADIKQVILKYNPKANVQFLPDRETVVISNETKAITPVIKELYERGFNVEQQKISLETGSDRQLKHSEICKACAKASNASPTLFRATYTCEGITCASCAQSIKSGLSPREVEVDVLSGIVYVNVSTELEAQQLVEEIGDIGFDAQLTELLPLASTYQLNFIVEGMTCASCSIAVTNALKPLDGVTDVQIDPVTGKAVIRASSPLGLDLIRETVEDLGYDVQFPTNFELLGSTTSESRTVTLAVHGIFCERCPTRVMNVLKKWGSAVEIIDEVSLASPFVKFTYIPSPPTLTIRSILAELQAANDQLTFEVVKQKSLEEIAAENQEKERKSVLKKLTLTSIIAIPLSFLMFSDLMMNSRLMFVLATPVYFFAASSFHLKAITDVKGVLRGAKSDKSWVKRLFHFGSMNLLMSLGTSISYFVSLAVMLFEPENETDSYFDSVIFLTFFLLIGRYLDIYSKIKTTSAVSLISKIRPDEVDLLNDTGVTTLPIELIEVGDLIQVLPGCRSAVDGQVIENETEFNEAMLTGESLPVHKSAGDLVYAGTLNCGLQSVKLRVAAVGHGTLLNDIVDCVRAGQMQRAPIERYVEEVTGVFVPVVIYLAILVWITWYLVSKNFLWSMHFAVATFVVACPCGIGLAAPTALYVGSGLSAKYGILARGGGEAFQEGSNLDLVCFDKTGTITRGDGLKITNHWVSDNNDAKIWSIAKLLEGDSVHPLATAVVQFIDEQNGGSEANSETASLSNISQIESNGRGMSATISSGKHESQVAVLGNEAAIHNVAKTKPTEEQQQILQKWKSEGNSVIILAIGDKIVLMFAAADELRPEAADVMKHLMSMKVHVYMISGDNYETAIAVAKSVGIPQSNVIANVLPQEKAAKVKELQETAGNSLGRQYGRAIVGMVGDGVNDAPALATSDVGIALGRGADIALQSSQFVLLREDLRGIPILIDISKQVMRRVKMNFFWAGIYNTVAIPIAAGVLYPMTHKRLDPVWASLAMALSSVSVMTSSLLLRRYKP